MDFSGLGYCTGKISFKFVSVAAERLRALESFRAQFWPEQCVLKPHCPAL